MIFNHTKSLYRHSIEYKHSNQVLKEHWVEGSVGKSVCKPLVLKLVITLAFVR